MVAPDKEQVELNTPANNSLPHHPSSIGINGIGRQLSIYSLTLDEFQNTLCETGKNFGSMNMDEFLTSIWTAEENNNQNDAALAMARQPISQLARQGSLSVPAPLCRKTVEEVWSEIQRGPHHPTRQAQQQPAQRQQTFGEMTLEDFLVRAGVVREPVPTHHHQQFGFGPGPMAVPGGGGYPALAQNGGGGGGEASAYVSPPGPPQAAGGGSSSSSKRNNNGYAAPVGPTAGFCYGGAAAALGMGSPVSPLGSEGLVDVGPLRPRKRTLDGPVEKVVERRQRRMIKNRESAARSRARKQAYTVELEAELNQLRDENAQLKQALQAELERQRNQESIEEQQKMPKQGRGHKAQDRVRLIRRSMSSPL